MVEPKVENLAYHLDYWKVAMKVEKMGEPKDERKGE